MEDGLFVSKASVNLRDYPIRVMRIPSHDIRPPHRHEFQELVLVLGGEGVHCFEGEEYPLAAGDTFVVLGDMWHGYPEVDHLSLINILYDLRRLNLPLADLGELPGYHALFNLEPQARRQQKLRNHLRLPPEGLDEASRLVTALETELGSDQPGHHCLANARLLELIVFLSRAYSQTAPAGSRTVDQLSKLLGHLERNYAKPINIKEMTRLAHMSETSLLRTFKQLTGHAPLEHLIHLRIARAGQLLRQTELPLSEIAERTGFYDANYLSRQFRQIVGVPPSEYRTRSSNNQPSP